MNQTEVKPLQPLSNGLVLIVGAKASNFDEEIKTNPRVIMWDSQHEHWTNKDIPSNVRAIFITRWIGHAAFKTIMSEARKKRITIFNPMGTGIIARQVKELLDLRKPVQEQETTPKMTPQIQVVHPLNTSSKLHVLIPFIDFSKGNTENGKLLMIKAQEMGISTTILSLAQFAGMQRKKKFGKGLKNTHPVTVKTPSVKTGGKLDVSVEILNGMIKELQDMRDFLIATTNENRSLRAKLDKFRKMIED